MSLAQELNLNRIKFYLVSTIDFKSPEFDS